MGENPKPEDFSGEGRWRAAERWETSDMRESDRVRKLE
jgi:hypothetical protein